MKLKRNDGSTKLEVGEYMPRVDEHWCVWKCPKCQKIANISRRVHTVDMFGEVTPEIKCPNDKCYYVDSYTLEDWVPTAKGSA